MTNENKPDENISELLGKILGDETRSLIERINPDILIRAYKHVEAVPTESGTDYNTGILTALSYTTYGNEKLLEKSMNVFELYPTNIAHIMGQMFEQAADRGKYSKILDYFSEPATIDAVADARTRLNDSDFRVFLCEKMEHPEKRAREDGTRRLIEYMQKQPRDEWQLSTIAQYIVCKAYGDAPLHLGRYHYLETDEIDLGSGFVPLELNDEEKEYIFERIRFSKPSEEGTPAIRALREHYGFALQERHLDMIIHSWSYRMLYNEIIDALSVRDPDAPSAKPFQEMLERFERDLDISKLIKNTGGEEK